MPFCLRKVHQGKERSRRTAERDQSRERRYLQSLLGRKERKAEQQMTDFKKEIIKKLMVQEELTRGSAAHWGIAKAIEIVENTPDESEDDLK